MTNTTISTPILDLIYYVAKGIDAGKQMVKISKECNSQLCKEIDICSRAGILIPVFPFVVKVVSNDEVFFAETAPRWNNQ